VEDLKTNVMERLAIFTRKIHDIKGVRSLERLPTDERDGNEEPNLNTTADRSHQYASRRAFFVKRDDVSPSDHDRDGTEVVPTPRNQAMQVFKKIQEMERNTREPAAVQKRSIKAANAGICA
jgi:hypothetical protein